MKCSNYDACIYYLINGSKMLIVAVYVDDLLIFSNDKILKDDLKSCLQKQFKMKDFGEAKCVLGMQITRDRKSETISINQSQYIQKVLDRFDMADCNSVSIPADPNQKLTAEMSPKNQSDRESMENMPYQEAIGSLLFAAQVSRPDIQFAVGAVSRLKNNPGVAHWLAVKRIMRYLKGTIDMKLTYSKNGNEVVQGYCDSDWASDSIDRRSTTGYVFKLQGGAISWASKKQPTVALSTTESEYMAMSLATQEAIWWQGLCQELLGEKKCLTIINCDNKGAIQLAEKTAFSPRTKHIDVRHHFLREKVNDKVVKFVYVNTNEMLADSLTKPVTAEKHKFCSKGVNLVMN